MDMFSDFSNDDAVFILDRAAEAIDVYVMSGLAAKVLSDMGQKDKGLVLAVGLMSIRDTFALMKKEIQKC